MEFIQGLSYFSYCLNFCWSMFASILNRAGATGYWFGAIFTVLVFHFFIFPLIGSRGSDQAKKTKKDDK